MTSSIKKSYLPNLDLLRIIAAYFVLLFHFRWEGSDGLTYIFSFGYLGVYVFFCISGFITPLAMEWSGYRLRDWKTFLISRFFRLYPAFAVIAVLEIILSGCGGFMGHGYTLDELTAFQLLSNFTWTAEFFQQDWLVPVFWTLAIEAQFTIVILLIHPLLTHRREVVRVLTVLVFIVATYFVGRGSGILSDSASFFSYSAIFSMGMLVYLHYTKRINIVLFVVLLGLAFYSHHKGVSAWHAKVALGTALFVTVVPQIHGRFISYFGKFAYSFFLIHITFGGAAMFHLRFLPSDWYFQLLRVFLASVVSFFAAWVFYYKVEKPCHEFSRRFKSKR